MAIAEDLEIDDERPTLKLQIILPTLTDDELAGLITYSMRKMHEQKFVAYHAWLIRVLGKEVERRAEPDAGIEPGMEPLPNFRPKHYAEFLLGASVHSYAPLTEAQAKFVDNAKMCVVVECWSMLCEYDDFLVENNLMSFSEEGANDGQ